MDKKPSPHNWLTVLESCESTNTWALERLSEFHPGDVIFTDNQTAGRGQFDRTWISSSGVLTASFVLELSIAQLSGLSLIAGLAVIHAIETLLPNLSDRLSLKWTNDVFAENRKLAGILCESRIRGNRAQVVVGIGLNCTSVPDSVSQAISLQELSNQVPEQQTLLEQLRYCLLKLSDRPFVELLPGIRSRDLTLGKTIVFETATEQVTGEAAGIDQEGQLLIRVAGKVKAYRSGRIRSL